MNIQLSTINEALREEEDDEVENACEGGLNDGRSRFSNHTDGIIRGKNTIVRFDIDSNQTDKVPL